MAKDFVKSRTSCVKDWSTAFGVVLGVTARKAMERLSGSAQSLAPSVVSRLLIRDSGNARLIIIGDE